MKNLIIVMTGIVALGALTGCGTIRGIGEDISGIGQFISKGSDKVQDDLQNRKK